MAWANACDVVRQDIADEKDLYLGSGLLLNTAKYIGEKNAITGGNLNILGMNSDNDVLVGYGGYSNGYGNTYVYGNSEVGIRSKGSFTISSTSAGLSKREFGANKILASPVMWMNSSQTVTLSEAVSAQPHGIVLAWSYYSDGSAYNYNWVYYFIPKHHVLNHNGTGIWSPCAGSGTTKYVYVYDTKIVGYSTQEYNGVLRYVIGV